MKLLIYTHEFPPYLGGLATTSYKLARGIAGSGIDLTVLAPSYTAEDRDADIGLDCKVIRMPGLRSRAAGFIPFAEILLGRFYLGRALRSERPDAVLFITEEAEAAGGLLGTFSFKPVVRVAGSGITTCFYSRRPVKRLMSYPMSRLYERAATIIAVSNNTKELLDSVGVPQEKISVVYNGVEDEMLSRGVDADRVAALRARYGLSANTAVLITVARVLPRKGQDTVIRALPGVIEKYPDIVYLVVGEGRYTDSFSNLARECGVGDKVIFTGGVTHEDTVSYLDLSDIFVMPNRFWNNKIEGLPNALLEASARAKPVIAGRHGGSVEAVRHGESGLLVDGESVDEVREALLELLSDRTKARSMGVRGREAICRSHTERLMIDNYVRVIREACGQGKLDT